MKTIAQSIIALGLVVAGMCGLYLRIEYSAIVLFIGLLVAVFV